MLKQRLLNVLLLACVFSLFSCSSSKEGELTSDVPTPKPLNNRGGESNNVDDGESGGGETRSNTTSTLNLTQSEIPFDQQMPIFVDEARVYLQTSPHRDALLRCAQISERTPCTTGELPFIGQETSDPTIADIMNRVVVTHDWTGLRFQEVLETYPSSVLKLFRPVTSIYIGSDRSTTAYRFDKSVLNVGIDDLWVNNEEKKAVFIETASSPRMGVEDNGLSFDSRVRRMKGSDFVSSSVLDADGCKQSD